jgi:hypothetical protein
MMSFWLSFTCVDAWRSTSSISAACGKSSWSSSPPFIPPPPSPRRPLPSRAGRREGDFVQNRAHPTTANDDVDVDGGGGDDGLTLFSGDARIVIQRIALDDIAGLECMSRFCIRSFYDDDDDIVERSCALSRYRYINKHAVGGVLIAIRFCHLARYLPSPPGVLNSIIYFVFMYLFISPHPPRHMQSVERYQVDRDAKGPVACELLLSLDMIY